jgi:hypothetical protein
MGAGLLPALLVAALQAPASPTPPALAVLAARMPISVGTATRQDPPTLYTPNSIFDYLDGGAEVYLAYGLRGCLAARYVTGTTGFTVDLFEMGSEADAFGVFTHDQDGEDVAIGCGALLRPGWLSFWQGRCFVSVTADGDDASVGATILALGQAVAALLPAGGRVPELVGRLPRQGLRPRSVRFLHDPVVLATHVARLDGNPLALSARCEVAVGSYQRGGERATLVLVVYPDAAAAQAAVETGCRALPGSCGEPAVRGVGGPFSSLRLVGSRAALALEATSAGLAAALVAEALVP